MFSKRWCRCASSSRSRRVASVALGFLLLRAARFDSKSSTQTAQHSFGQLKLNLLILGLSSRRSDHRLRSSSRTSTSDGARPRSCRSRETRGCRFPEQGFDEDQLRLRLRRSACDRASRRASCWEAFPSTPSWRCSPKARPQIVDAMGGLDVNVDEDDGLRRQQR